MLSRLLTTVRDLMRPASPTLQVYGHPNGTQALALVQTGEGSYKLETLPGARNEVPSHCFEEISDLVAYLKHRSAIDRVAASHASILVGVSGVTALFDDETEAGCSTTQVGCSLRFDERFEPWVARGQTWRNPLEAQRFLRNVPGNMVGTVIYAARREEDVEIGRYLVQQLSNLYIGGVKGTKLVLSPTGVWKTVVTSEDNEVPANIPERFALRLPIYDGADVEVEVEILVHMRVQDGMPEFAFEVANKTGAILAGRRHVRDGLRAQLGDGWMVGLGTAGTKVVDSGPYYGTTRDQDAGFRFIPVDPPKPAEGAANPEPAPAE